MKDRFEKLRKISNAGSLWRVKLAVSRGVTEDEKNMLLKSAVLYGHLSIVKYLHKKGADIINTTFADGDNLSQTAVYYSNLAVARYLAENGTEVKAKYHDGEVFLIKAIKNENLDEARFLISTGIKVDVQDNTGNTALVYAVLHDMPDMVRLLINKGANVNFRSGDRFTPLHYAARDGYFDVMKILVENGADVNAQDSKGQTALMLSAMIPADYSAVAVDRYYRSLGLNPNEIRSMPTREAARWLDRAGVEYKIDDNGDFIVDVPKLSFKFARYLYDHGADPNIRDNDGRTAGHYAARGGK